MQKIIDGLPLRRKYKRAKKTIPLDESDESGEGDLAIRDQTDFDRWFENEFVRPTDEDNVGAGQDIFEAPVRIFINFPSFFINQTLQFNLECRARSGSWPGDI